MLKALIKILFLFILTISQNVLGEELKESKLKLLEAVYNCECIYENLYDELKPKSKQFYQSICPRNKSKNDYLWSSNGNPFINDVSYVNCAFDVEVYPDPIKFEIDNIGSVSGNNQSFNQMCTKDLTIFNNGDEDITLTSIKVIDERTNSEDINYRIRDFYNYIIYYDLATNRLVNLFEETIIPSNSSIKFKVNYLPVYNSEVYTSSIQYKFKREKLSAIYSSEISTVQSGESKDPCMKMIPFDATGIVGSLGDDYYLDDDGNVIDEKELANSLGWLVENGNVNSDFYAEKRNAIVLDNNARLIFAVNINNDIISGSNQGVTVNIINNVGESSIERVIDRLSPEYYPLSLYKGKLDNYSTAVFILKAGRHTKNYDPEVSNSIKLEICMTDNGGTACNQVEIPVYKPPVTLVHGLWSTPGTFGNIGKWGKGESGLYEELIDNDYVVSYVQYDDSSDNYRNSLGLELVLEENHIQDAINNACDYYRYKKDAACTRSDFVAHSLGGIMTRYFIHTRSKEDKNSFKEGSVNRFISIASPHDGTGVADLLIGNDRNIQCITADGRVFLSYLRKVMNFIGLPQRSGLVELQINGLGPTTPTSSMEKIPFYSITGDIGKNLIDIFPDADKNFGDMIYVSALTFPIYYNSISSMFDDENKCSSISACLSEIIEVTTGCDYEHIMQGKNSDGMVSVPSGKWSYNLSLSTSRNIYGVNHTNMGTKPVIIYHVMRILDLPDDSYYKME